MPDDQPEIEDIDFAGEMHHLAYEAQLKSPSSPPAPRLDRKELMLALGQMVRPLALELENIKRATAENAVLLTVLSKAAKTVTPAPSAPVAAPVSAPELDAIERISQQLQRLGSVETANQKLFDALHTELKGYKDNFLFDALQRPFIRDLVAIFDDFSAVQAQVSNRLALQERAEDGAPAGSGAMAAFDPAAEDLVDQSETDFLRSLAGNVDNQIHHLLEVFLRLEVVLSESAPGTAVDKKMHRMVAFKPAASPDEDAQVVRSLKPGFTWRERMIRPEEVVVYRWTNDPPGSSTPLEKEKDAPTNKPAPAPDHRRPSAAGKSTTQDDTRITMRIPNRDVNRRKPPTEALL